MKVKKYLAMIMVLFAVLALNGCSAPHYAWSGGGTERGRKFAKVVYRGDLTAVKSMLEENPELVNAEAKNAWELYPARTPLYDAIERGHTDMAKLLIDKGANVNAKLQGGNSYLFRAIYNRQKEIVKLLIDNGANVNVYNYIFGETGLGWAICNGQKDIVKLLIENGVDVNAKSRGGATPLHKAIRFGHKDIAELLITEGADVKAKDNKGRTALTVAFECGNNEVADLLKKHGAVK